VDTTDYIPKQEVVEIHKILDGMSGPDFPDRRQSERRAFTEVQLLAPCSEAKVPREPEFREVRCQSISKSGVSFYLPEPPDFDYALLALGKAPNQIGVLAKVVHYGQYDATANGEYVVGCQLLHRVKLSSLAHSVSSPVRPGN